MNMETLIIFIGTKSTKNSENAADFASAAPEFRFKCPVISVKLPEAH